MVKRIGLPVGLHVTLTCEWDYLRWSPLSSGPTLRGVDGTFHRTVEDAASGRLRSDAIAEAHAQADRADTLGLELTYVDPHMGVSVPAAYAGDVRTVRREVHLPRHRAAPRVGVAHRAQPCAVRRSCGRGSPSGSSRSAPAPTSCCRIRPSSRDELPRDHRPSERERRVGRTDPRPRPGARCATLRCDPSSSDGRSSSRRSLSARLSRGRTSPSISAMSTFLVAASDSPALRRSSMNDSTLVTRCSAEAAWPRSDRRGARRTRPRRCAPSTPRCSLRWLSISSMAPGSSSATAFSVRRMCPWQLPVIARGEDEGRAATRLGLRPRRRRRWHASSDRLSSARPGSRARRACEPKRLNTVALATPAFSASSATVACAKSPRHDHVLGCLEHSVAGSRRVDARVASLRGCMAYVTAYRLLRRTVQTISLDS